MARGGVNKVILIGNIGADPELRYTPNGSAVSNFNIATNESWTDSSGERQERTEWHRIRGMGQACGNLQSIPAEGQQGVYRGASADPQLGRTGRAEALYHRGGCQRHAYVEWTRRSRCRWRFFPRDSVPRRREPPAIGRVPPKRAAARTRDRAGRARRPTAAPTTISRSERGGLRHRESV